MKEKKPAIDSNKKAQLIKQLSMVVCICKGIPLSKFLPKLSVDASTEEIHQKVGSGCGGCQGRRCSPRIKTLLQKLKDSEKEPDQDVENSTD